MFYEEEIRGLIFTMFTHKKLEIVFVFVQRSGSGNLLMDFLAFIEQTWKENNIYLIGVFIIENVEVRLIENDSRKYRDIVGLYVCLC